MRLILTLDDTDSKKRIEHKAVTLCWSSQMTRKDATTQWTPWVLAIAIIPQQPPMDCHQDDMQVANRSQAGKYLTKPEIIMQAAISS